MICELSLRCHRTKTGFDGTKSDVLPDGMKEAASFYILTKLSLAYQTRSRAPKPHPLVD